MTTHQFVDLSSITVGQEVTIFRMEDGHPTWGQGGVVTALTPDVVVTAAGTPHSFPAMEFPALWGVEVEVPTDPSECLEFGPDCSGPVEWYSPNGGKQWQRCLAHRELRAQRYSSSIEQYADMSGAPSWLDPTYAGETWDND